MTVGQGAEKVRAWGRSGRVEGQGTQKVRVRKGQCTQGCSVSHAMLGRGCITWDAV